MYKTEDENGNIHMKSTSIDVEKAKVDELKDYLKELEGRRNKLIEEQNNCLSQIIN